MTRSGSSYRRGCRRRITICSRRGSLRRDRFHSSTRRSTTASRRRRRHRRLFWSFTINHLRRRMTLGLSQLGYSVRAGSGCHGRRRRPSHTICLHLSLPRHAARAHTSGVRPRTRGCRITLRTRAAGIAFVGSSMKSVLRPAPRRRMPRDRVRRENNAANSEVSRY